MKKKYLPLIILLTVVITAGCVFGGERLSVNVVGHKPFSELIPYSMGKYSIYYEKREANNSIDLNRKQIAECAEILSHIRIYEEVELVEIPSYSYKVKSLPSIDVSVDKSPQMLPENTRVSIYSSEVCFINEISYRMKLPEEYYERYLALEEELDIALESERS